MDKFLISFLLFLNTILFSQNRFHIYDSKQQDTIFYYSEGDDVFRCSAKKNRGRADKCEIKESMPFNAEEYKIWIRILKCKDGKFVPYNKNYIYDLPFKKGQYYKITQGYNGDFSHSDINAIDFEMPMGTEILASRDGLVIRAIHHHNKGCPSQDCAKYGNYISILHADGTRADYYHLKHDGVIVKAGDKVKKGDLIGYSGNTGWSNGSHLHFVCYYSPNCGTSNEKTIKTLFRTGDGKRVEYLQEGKSYLKNY